jgi:tetratricopeptide (TPR) repeat protein
MTSIIVLSLLTLGGLIATRHQVHQWRTNLSLWQQAIDNYTGNWYALYNRAKLISHEDPQGAIADLNLALQKMKGLTELYFARGTILMEQGKTLEAIADFNTVIEKEPNHTEARINRGNSYRTLGRLQEAIEDYSAVLKVKPKVWKALNNRGLAYLDLGLFDEAGEDFSAAIAGKADYANPYLNRGNLRLRPEVADYTGAIQDFTTYLRFEAQSHEALFRRGYAKLRMGAASDALKDMNEAIRIHGNQGFYFLGRAQVFEALGNHEGAARDLQKARSLGVRTGE